MYVFYLFIEPFYCNLHFIPNVLLLFQIPLQRTRQFVFVTRCSLLIMNALLLLQRLSLHFFRTPHAHRNYLALRCCFCCNSAGNLPLLVHVRSLARAHVYTATITSPHTRFVFIARTFRLHRHAAAVEFFDFPNLFWHFVSSLIF